MHTALSRSPVRSLATRCPGRSPLPQLPDEQAIRTPARFSKYAPTRAGGRPLPSPSPACLERFCGPADGSLMLRFTKMFSLSYNLLAPPAGLVGSQDCSPTSGPDAPGPAAVAEVPRTSDLSPRCGQCAFARSTAGTAHRTDLSASLQPR
jgi:hypothetical protein